MSTSLTVVDTLIQEQPPVVEAAPATRRATPAQPTDSIFATALDGDDQQVVVSTSFYDAVFSTRGGTLQSFALKNYERSDLESNVQIIDTTKLGALGMVFTSPASHSVDTRQLFFAADTNRDTLRVVDTAQQLTFEAALGEGRLNCFMPEGDQLPGGDA